MDKRMILRGLSTISALGVTPLEISKSLEEPVSQAVPLEERNGRPVFPLTKAGHAAVEELSCIARYSRLDRVAHLALVAARATLDGAAGSHGDIGCVSIGSSRGATISLECTIGNFAGDPLKVPTETSPTTTAGNISSWVAQEYLSRGIGARSAAPLASLSTSMTCSSAFHSLLTSLAFVRSGMASAALFGGAEACLTPYTVAHLEALRIYSDQNLPWPCRPGGSLEGLANAVVLGEGAGTAILMEADGTVAPGDLELKGIGWSLEETPTATGVSADGLAFERSMRMAIDGLSPGERVDTVIAHAPGSIKGDEAELRAIERTLGSVMVCSTKHLTGHTYGASGMVSLTLAQALLDGVPWRGFPYGSRIPMVRVEAPRLVLINTAGFGGNSISILVGAATRGQ